MSVNPVDVKRRAGLDPSATPVIFGYDAAGTVEAVGAAVTTFSPGDEVWYAGDITRQGGNAELQAVDERIVGPKPKSLSFKDSAALPLTTITAWETLFERFGLTSESRGDLLVLGAAGGVGSVMVQLAKALTGVRVIATASRADSQDWAPDGVDYLFSPHSKGNVETFVDIVRPFGHITAIDEPAGLDVLPLKAKSIAWHWELMFTRPLFSYDLIAQQRLLTRTVDSIVRRFGFDRGPPRRRNGPDGRQGRRPPLAGTRTHTIGLMGSSIPSRSLPRIS
ncbi:alcohol dehydrogenase catalytic domain-containing protein [Mycobacterium sp. AZCC_0083]|uniref:alcohol dehydrogenase catalytic domain-containing protein n=1 Tax=Mycobacterium sp. AZCC_0083 TaxID=2735882 RepID=UPI00185A7737|nr:alcohol dehydrogenase catalytic domain-containing protein [Mycobacterium sp. AZCC_0083]MBB5163138.1 hypothetical protein [Mycobacterium sp. AZCC_0083]